jgi:hypothetical protein
MRISAALIPRPCAVSGASGRRGMGLPCSGSLEGLRRGRSVKRRTYGDRL